MRPNTNTPSSSANTKSWEETIAWLDFSDGALVAEIVAHHLPRYVLSSNSFPQVHSLALKKYNWETLERTVLCHLGIRLSVEDIESLANAEEGAIQTFLAILRVKIDSAITQRRFRPSSTSRGSSRSCSRGGSQLHLDRIGGLQGQSNGGGGNGRPKVLDELDQGQLVEKLYAKVREQETQLRKKDEQIEALSRKVDKLLEMVCEECLKSTND
uniref:CH-like domain-containing protein n=1 Tax=Globodera rostochiensis TaxID=31243 RepID=A0A914H8N9_GLORO